MSTPLMTPSYDLLRLLRRLRRAREARPLSQAAVAEAMGWSVSKVIRIENGQSGISTRDLKALLDLYQIIDIAEVTEILGIAEASRLPPWWSEFTDLVPRDFARQLGYESSAAQLLQYHSTVVPGLLQSPDYSRAILRVFGREEDIERGVRLRRRRHEEVFGRPEPPASQFIIGEGALRNEVGGADVLKGQLDFLLELMDGGVGIEVVPFTAGAHQGLIGDFEIVSFNGEGGDLVSVESPQGYTLLDDEAVVKQYRRILADIHGVALTGADARALIEHLRTPGGPGSA